MTSTLAAASAGGVALRRPATIEVLFLIALLAPFFALNVFLAFTLHRLGVTRQFNVIFDTDLLTRLSCFSTGWGGFGRNPAHPNLCNFVNPLVRVAAIATAKSGLHANDLALRQEISLLVAPLAGLAQLTVSFLTLRLLRVPRAARFALTLLNASSFTYLIFATVPDHFILGGLALTLSLYAAAKAISTGRDHPWLWLVAGLLAAGITITNAFGFGILLLASCLSIFPWRKALRRTAIVCASVAAITLTVYVAMSHLYHSPIGDAAEINNWADQYFRDTPLANLASYPLAVGSAIAPSAIGTKPNTFPVRGARYDFQMEILSPATHLSWASLIQAAFVLIMAAGLILAVKRREPGAFPIAVSCGLILLFNAILHAFWGGDYFLFSQHWQGAAIALAGLAFLAIPPKFRKAGLAMLACMAAATAINSAILLETMLRLLGA